MDGRQVQTPLSDLYLEDETAWLEAMSQLAAERRHEEFDYEHLSEYLADMAKRDRREVASRLTTLLAHLLKWEYQPAHRSNSWRATIDEQQHELQMLLESRTLLNHANAALSKAYKHAARRAALETGLPETTFPTECPFSLDVILGPD
jgi:hypothetical protein